MIRLASTKHPLIAGIVYQERRVSVKNNECAVFREKNIIRILRVPHLVRWWVTPAVHKVIDGTTWIWVRRPESWPVVFCTCHIVLYSNEVFPEAALIWNSKMFVQTAKKCFSRVTGSTWPHLRSWLFLKVCVSQPLDCNAGGLLLRHRS